jgi:hypothetical protein
MTTSTDFFHVPAWRAVRLFVCDRQGFVSAAVNHGMAVNLESPSQLAHYQAGTYPVGWEIEARANASHKTDELCQAIQSSLITALVVTFIAIILAFTLSLIAINLPIAWGKVVNAIGVFFAGWATLFALGTPVRSWKGKSLPESIHPKIFIGIFVPGLLLSSLGQLW